ncbi:MAG: DNA recombination protein RmuC [Pseudomonadota bacterium]
MDTGGFILAGLVLLVVALLVSVFLNFRRSSRIAQLTAEVVQFTADLAASEAEYDLINQRGGVVQAQLEQQLQTTQQLREQVARLESGFSVERQQHAEKVQMLMQAREQMALEFRQVANEIFEQKGRVFTETSNLQIQQLLQPLGDKLRTFEQKVDETYDKESKQRFSLEKEIRNLLELNTRISDDANRLTNALKGENKTQGTWGEVILERVLERSGLVKGREYDVQVSLKDEDGRKSQPDVVVHLPEQKDIVIDSKVTLTAYQAYHGATDDEQRELYLKQHIASIRSHIRNLAGKNYHDLPGLRSLDYVLMFLPVEAAFTLAVQHDDTLFTEAFDRNIMLVGPSTLLATLRTIQNIWRYEYQNKHALEIARQAGMLYDKFAAFAQDLNKIGERIGQTQNAWNDAQNKLLSGRGNLVSRAEKLKTLGVRASKSLPEQLPDASDGNDDDADA